MSKRKGSCINKYLGKCILTDKYCNLKNEDGYLCDDFVEYEGREDEE